MRHDIRSFLWYMSQSQPVGGPILEIGSKVARGQVGFADLRPLFREKEYTGCDVEMGIGVDVVVAEHHLGFPDQSFKLVLCMDTLEHCHHPMHMMEEIHRVLIDGGTTIISSHMDAPWHYDPDYWRFTPQCFQEILLSEFSEKEVFYQGPRGCPTNVVGVGLKGDSWPFQIDLGYLNSMLPFDGAPYPYEKF